MLLEVERVGAAGAAYTRLRRLAGLPPVKETLTAVPISRAAKDGPVHVRCAGVTYVLTYKRSGEPVTAA